MKENKDGKFVRMDIPDWLAKEKHLWKSEVEAFGERRVEPGYYGQIAQETEKAIKFKEGLSEREVWLPKSQIKVEEVEEEYLPAEMRYIIKKGDDKND